VWWGTVNIKMDEEGFLVNRERAIDFLNSVEQVQGEGGVGVGGFVLVGV